MWVTKDKGSWGYLSGRCCQAVKGEERQAKALGQKIYLHEFPVEEKSVQLAKES